MTNTQLTSTKERLRAEIMGQISTSAFCAPGSSGQPGVPYHELFFEEFRTAGTRRSESQSRLDAIVRNYDLRGKTVLDIGCNVGYFSFGLAAKGARVIGIDHDRDSILLATKLKDYYSIDNVDFEPVGLSAPVARDLAARYGKPDLILLNSVIHWLFYACDDLSGVNNALGPLLSDDKPQTIIYEPSSSDVAYYPELLSNSGVKEFFASLGVFEYSALGQFWVSNTAQRRNYYLGVRDIRSLKQEAAQLLASPSYDKLTVGQPSIFGIVRSIRRHKGKIVICTDSCVLKTHEAKNQAAFLLMQNESAMLLKFCSEFKPNLLWAGKIGDRFVLLFARSKGMTLDRSWVGSTDAKIISKCLDRLLLDLNLSGITHNDIRPHNLVWVKSSKTLTLIDFEYTRPIGQDLSALMANLTEESDRSYIASQLNELGGQWRSPFGPFNIENDRFAAKTVSYLILNRRRYLIKKILELSGLAKVIRNVKRRLGTLR